jgi:hypothetical protein
MAADVAAPLPPSRAAICKAPRKELASSTKKSFSWPTANAKPGLYPFMCSIPGHCTLYEHWMVVRVRAC